MSSVLEILMTAITIIETGIGITVNTFILTYSFKSMKTRSSSNPIHVIHFTMGLVNVLMQLLHTLQNFLFCFWIQMLIIREVQLTLIFLMLGPTCCTYWLTGWLCVYYCITINNFTHQLIIRFKKILLSFLPHILLLSITGSLIICVLSVLVVDVVILVQNSTEDFSTFALDIVMPRWFMLTTTCLGYCLPFAITLISTGVTTSSLIKHLLTMKRNISEKSSPNLQALINATRTMTLFIILSVIYYLASILLSSTNRRSFSDPTTIIAWIITAFFPSAEGAIISQATPRLRKMIREKCCAKRQTSNVIN